MSAEKTLAIVLKTVEFSETSLVVSLFTQEHGKISALAKGARRPKGPFENALDLLAICRVVFLRKSSGSLDLLTEAKLERRFRAAARSLPALNAGYYVAELLRELTDEHDPHPELFRLADDTFAALDENRDPTATVLRFELSALRELGHLPALDHCTHCGAPVEIAGRVAFGLIGGGVLCLQCKPGKRQVASVSGAAIAAMQSLADEEQDYTASPLALEKPLSGEIRGLMNRYICNLLGHRPKTQLLVST
jgi:DNA repair protein RecO (recombination protein O)